MTSIFRRIVYLALAIIAVFSCQSTALAQRAPVDTLLPETSKGLFISPDLPEAIAQFEKTGMGRLSADPVMQPFMDELNMQMGKTFAVGGVVLDISMDSLAAIAGGEVGAAFVQPKGDKRQAARVMLIDTTGKTAAAQEFIQKQEATLLAGGGKKLLYTVEEERVVMIQMPKRPGAIFQQRLFYAFADDWLILTTYWFETVEIIGRIKGKEVKHPAIATVDGYVKATAKANNAHAGAATHVRFYVQPLGFAEVTRAFKGARNQAKTDRLAVLEDQGFGAVQAVAGMLQFNTGTHENLHHSFVYAPGKKFEKAARILSFPEHGGLDAQPWVPDDLSAYGTFHWETQEAFEFSKSLVDQMAGDEIFETVLRNYAEAPAAGGLGVDIRKELIAHLGTRATLLADYVEPFSADSSRQVMAVELTAPAAVLAVMHRVLDTDPDTTVHEVKIAGNMESVWEIAPPVEEKEEVRRPGGPRRPRGRPDRGDEEPKGDPLFMTVAHGHLLMSNQLGLVSKLMETPKNSLVAAPDYKRVNAALAQLGGGGKESFRFFRRTDRFYRPNYELMKQGEMPKSKTMFGKLLNAVFESEEGVVRKQQIDGTKMPAFKQIEPNLGPAGSFVTNDPDGWLITGCLLEK